MNQRINVARKIDAISKEEEKRYEIRLTSSLDVARFVIMQGDAFLTQFINLYDSWVGVLHSVVLICVTNLLCHFYTLSGLVYKTSSVF